MSTTEPAVSPTDWIDLEEEQPWCLDVIDRMRTLSDEALMWLLAGAQGTIRERNEADGGEDDPSRPWRTVRHHAVPDRFDQPTRLTFTWSHFPPGTRALIYAAGSGQERPRAKIVMHAALRRRERRASLVHELVHWERGVQSRALGGGSWERYEEERVVRAIAADRIAEI